MAYPHNKVRAVVSTEFTIDDLGVLHIVQVVLVFLVIRRRFVEILEVLVVVPVHFLQIIDFQARVFLLGLEETQHEVEFDVREDDEDGQDVEEEEHQRDYQPRDGHRPVRVGVDFRHALLLKLAF